MCVLQSDSRETQVLLKKIELGDVWGVGRRLVDRLAVMGIKSAWDLAQANPKEIRRRFSVTLEHTALELRGVPCIEMNDFDEARKRIMTSRSFGKLTDNLDEIREAMRQHGQRGAEKLRRQGSLARAVLVFLKTNPFRNDLPQYSPRLVIELPYPTDDSRAILSATGQALQRIYRRGYLYQKGGVMLLDLIDARRQQLSLFDTPQSESERHRSQKLMSVMDELNGKMGRGTVRLGTPTPGAAWHLRCAHRTRRYSTRWEELPSALAR